MKNWPKGDVAVVTLPTFRILRPPNIYGTAVRYKLQILQADCDTKPENEK